MKPSIKLIHWLPRIICILAILFVSMFALDAFAPGLTLWQQLGSFLMNLIPSFILLAALIVAWKWEYAGGIIFTAIGLITSPLVLMHNYNNNHLSFGASLGIVLMVCLPFIVVGLLFITSYFLKKK